MPGIRSETIGLEPSPEWKNGYKERGNRTMMCERCGALVTQEQHPATLHTNFHRDLDRMLAAVTE